jgi:hypothetical protein
MQICAENLKVMGTTGHDWLLPSCNFDRGPKTPRVMCLDIWGRCAPCFEERGECEHDDY